MAHFESEFLENGVAGDAAWRRITTLLRSGSKSVEVLSRQVEGERVWELRRWNAIRQDKSNSAGAPPSGDY